MNNRMETYVTLLDASPVQLAIVALRRCWASEDKSDSYFAATGLGILSNPERHSTSDEITIGLSDRRLVENALEDDHTSVLEHIKFTFDIGGVSRGLLQELARHRIASLSVQSSRYTLKRIVANSDESTIKNLLVSSGDEDLDRLNTEHMVKVAELGRRKALRNDVLKYGIVEAYQTSLIWTINIRSLRNFLRLRTSPRAHWEIKALATQVYEALPPGYKMFFADFMEG